MKKILMLTVLGVSVVASTQVSATNTVGLIGKEQAREIAYTHAGVTAPTAVQNKLIPLGA